MEELNYGADDFSDILAKDNRFNARAYTVLASVVKTLCGEASDRHFSSQDVMEEFRETVLDQFGPLSYTVLSEWGVRSCADLGDMMFNFVESSRIGRDENDAHEDFLAGYDFEEAFLGPYRT